MSKYAFIVAATGTYSPELVAQLNSLDYVGNKQDVHVIGIDLEESIINQFPKLSYKVVFHDVKESEWQLNRGKSETVCRKRYWYAAEIGKDYDAVCVLDADLVWNRDPIQYFTMAHKTGYILGPSKEQNKVYDHEHHEANGKWIWNVPRGYYNDKDLCNCPVFIDAKLWHDALVMSWDVFINHGFRAPDMDAMSLAFLQYGSADKTVLLPGIQFLGTNEQHLKPYMRVILDRGMMKTESGIPIYCFHGQYYHKSWRDNQLNNRHNCAIGYLKADKHQEVINNLDGQANGSMNTLYSYFTKMLDYKIQIEKKNYRHPEQPLDA